MRWPRRFSWDQAKSDRNASSRGIDFSVAHSFDFETAVIAIDDRRDYGEVREVATGFVGPRLHVLVYTMRGEMCHVISLRKANKREIRVYVRKISQD